MNLSTNPTDIVISSEILSTYPSEAGYLNAIELKDPRSAALGSGELGER
jgi:hypothetical protein